MHKKYAPSSMGIQVKCTGYAEMTAEYRSEPGEAANIGTAAHWVAEQRLRSGGVIPEVGTITPVGLPVTQEMINDTTDYVNACLAIPGEHHIEEYVDCPKIHATDCGGTPDFWCLSPNDMTLYLKDYKNGRVAVREFWQLITYVSGVISKLGVNDQQLMVHMEIHQPNAWCIDGKVRVWHGQATDLRGYINQLWNACNHEPTLTTGNHCRYCRARLVCPANHQAAMNAVDVANMPMDKQQTNQDRELDLLTRAAEVINNRLAALQAEMVTRIEAGESFTNWKMHNGRGSTIWNDPDQIITMGSLLGLDLRNPKPITPKQAEKAGMDGELIKQLSTYQPGKLSLTRIENTIANSVFSGGKPV